MSDSDITNYAYVWYESDSASASQINKGDLDKVYDIILNYSYPCYLSGSEIIRQLTPEQKINLLQHELLFIKQKMVEAGLNNIIMIQIPRVLYDLFNIYFECSTYTDVPVDHPSQVGIEWTTRDATPEFDYTCSTRMAKIVNYTAITRRYTDFVKDRIFALNAFIVKYIEKICSISTIRDCYDNIAYQLVVKCWSLTEEGGAVSARALRFKMFDKISIEEAKNIVRQTIHFEKQDSQGHAILYRGANNNVDSLIDIQENYWSNPPSCDKQMPQKSSIPCLTHFFRSLSFNLSIFTGCAYDDGACTISYFSQFSYSLTEKTPNDKIKFNIKKFLFDDSSNSSMENSLFFIPPIHPYVQLYCTGELFHPRTKIGIDYLDYVRKFKKTVPRFYTSNDLVKGLFKCLPNEEFFIEQCDYLKSTETHEQLNALYQRYKTTSLISTWYSDAAAQSKKEQFMKIRAATVKEAALRGSTLPEKSKIEWIGNEWKKLEAIPGETKFKAIEKYYPELRKKIRYMMSNYMSRFLYSVCPKSSVTVSYDQRDHDYYRDSISYPAATIEFESKSDFQECQKKIQRFTYTEGIPDLQEGSITSFLHNGIVKKLFENSQWNLSAESELYNERYEISKISNEIFDIREFLSKYSYPHLRRDNDIEYKNNLNNYFMFMSKIFPQLQTQWQRGGGKTRRNLKRSRHRKKQFKSTNKIESKSKNKTNKKYKIK